MWGMITGKFSVSSATSSQERWLSQGISWAPEEAILEKEEEANEDLQKNKIYLILTMRALEPYGHPQAEQGGEKSAQLEQSFRIAAGFFPWI